MSSPKLIRRGGLAAVVGGILRILYLFYALAYFATEDGALSPEALLLFGIGFSLFGMGTLWAKVAPRPGAWLLTVGGCREVPVELSAETTHPGVPADQRSAGSVGASLYSGKVARARQPAHVG